MNYVLKKWWPLVESLTGRSSCFLRGSRCTQLRVETRWNRRSSGRVERVVPQKPLTCEVDAECSNVAEIWRSNTFRKVVQKIAGPSGSNLTPILWVCHPSSISSASLPGTCAKIMEGSMNMNMISWLWWEFAWKGKNSITIRNARWRIMDFCKSSKAFNHKYVCENLQPAVWKKSKLELAFGWSALELSGTASSLGRSPCSWTSKHLLWPTV